MEIKTPEHLTTLLKSLSLDDKAKFELNKKLANHTRREFRQQVKAQRSISTGKSYSPRNKKALKNNQPSRKNMLMGFSRNLKTAVSRDQFSVGLAGLEGHIAQIHNEGKSVVYTRKINAFFNSKTNRWEGGTQQKAAYSMPKRDMIGWNKTLERELVQIIFKEIQPK